MKCHICLQEIVQPLNFGLDNLTHEWYLECPDGHVSICYSGNGEIKSYTCFLDLDENANERYRIVASLLETVVYRRQSLRYYRDLNWVKVMDIDHMLPLQTKNDVVVFDMELIQKLQRLRVFA